MIPDANTRKPLICWVRPFGTVCDNKTIRRAAAKKFCLYAARRPPTASCRIAVRQIHFSWWLELWA